MKSHVIMGILSCAVSLSTFAAEPPQKSTSSVKKNLNTAKPSELVHVVKGIGKKRAHDIVAYRDEHHGFKTIEELGNVPGIGKRFVTTHLLELQRVFKLSE